MSQKLKSDILLEVLREDILRGLIAPGTEVSEIGIADRYTAGRAAARNALQKLTAIGLVKPVARRGYLIVPVTIRDVREVFQLRSVLEPFAARQAVGQIDAELLREREKRAVAESKPSMSANSDAAIEHNRFIHMAIADATGNKRLAQQINQLLGESERILLIGLAGGARIKQMISEHLPLIDALAVGDADLAENLMRAHIATASANVMDAIVARDTIIDRPLTGGR